MFQDGFPSDLRDDVSKVVSLIPFKTCYNTNIGVLEHTIQYLQDGAEIKFPYRIYYMEVPSEDLNRLNLQQKMILHCIYSRSFDGYVRQQNLHSLLLMDYDDWAIPYIVKLCDEYVLEILETVYDILKEQDTERFKIFCLENTQSFCRSYDRMISYWNEYYRYKYKNFHHYVGRKLFKECFGYSSSFIQRK